MPVLPGESACFRCIYPEAPAGVQPTCETAGVLGPVTSMIGSIQAMEAMKILSGRTASVRRRIFTADLWHGPIRETAMPPRDVDCPCCGRRDFVYLNGRRAPVSLCGRNAVQIHERRRPLDLTDLAARLDGLGSVRRQRIRAPLQLAGLTKLPCFPMAAPSSRAPPTSGSRAAFTRNTSGIEREMRFVYLHGFASSPGSRKAQAFQSALPSLEIPALDGGDFEHLTISGQLAVMESVLGGEPARLIGFEHGRLSRRLIRGRPIRKCRVWCCWHRLSGSRRAGKQRPVSKSFTMAPGPCAAFTTAWSRMRCDIHRFPISPSRP